MGQFYYEIIGSRFGKLGVVWRRLQSQSKLVRVMLPYPRMAVERVIKRQFPGAQRACCREMIRISIRIRNFLRGSQVRLTLEQCDLAGMNNFQKRVLLLESQIPRGAVSTYGRLAHKLGKPNHARAVGRALAKNPFPVIIPCHRVIKSDGSIGGYAGGVRMKKKLLEMEGVRFDNRGKALIERFW